MTVAIAWYAVGVGALMLVWWAVDVAGGALHRADRAGVEIRLHLTAELVTAGWLIAGGVSLLTIGDTATAFAAAGLGMLLYTLIQSPGYFLAREEVAPVVLFLLLGTATAVALTALVTA